MLVEASEEFQGKLYWSVGLVIVGSTGIHPGCGSRSIDDQRGESIFAKIIYYQLLISTSSW